MYTVTTPEIKYVHIERVNTEFANKTIIFNIAQVLNNTSNLITGKDCTHSLDLITMYAKTNSPSQTTTINVICQNAKNKNGKNQVIFKYMFNFLHVFILTFVIYLKYLCGMRTCQLMQTYKKCFWIMLTKALFII